MKENSIKAFQFSTLYAKLSHNEFMIVLNYVTDFCFVGKENNDTYFIHIYLLCSLNKRY